MNDRPMKNQFTRALEAASPAQILKIRSVISKDACYHDGVFLYGRMIEAALTQLLEGDYDNENLITVLEDLVPSDKLAAALS